MKAMGLDLGKNLGFGLLGGRNGVLSGSYQVLKSWSPLGAAVITMEIRLQALIDKHRPDVIGVARPFSKRGDTPQNLAPMYAAFTTLHRVAFINKIPLEVIQESDARSAFLGDGNMPRGSEALKKAVHQACRDRGWLARDFECSDALCIASATLDRRKPSRVHETTPLWTVQKRRKAA